jgi:hypothetical protein
VRVWDILLSERRKVSGLGEGEVSCTDMNTTNVAGNPGQSVRILDLEDRRSRQGKASRYALVHLDLGTSDHY